MIVTAYGTLIFDCDGVLLNSNPIKTEAFSTVAMRFGTQAAERLVAHHVAHGGVSRIRKFEHLIHEILGREPAIGEIDELCHAYGEAVSNGLRSCEIASGLEELRALTPDARWMVVSGGAQEELREIFDERGLTPLFDGGIFGNPDTKDEILARESAAGHILAPALFVGDSRYDYEAASRGGIDFVFVYGWSEFVKGAEFFRRRNVPITRNLRTLRDGVSAGPMGSA